VRHRGHEVSFDWSSKEVSSIQRAASFQIVSMKCSRSQKAIESPLHTISTGQIMGRRLWPQISVLWTNRRFLSTLLSRSFSNVPHFFQKLSIICCYEYAFGYQPDEEVEKEEKYGYSDDSDGTPRKDVQDHLTKRAFVSRRLFSAQLHEIMFYEEPLNPANIVSHKKDKKRKRSFIERPLLGSMAVQNRSRTLLWPTLL
jgi:hypothetical protein